MGIRIDGASDLINATDGSLTIEGQSINSTGIGTFSGGVKVGSAATIHSTGQFNIGVAATIFASGNATFAGIVTTAQLGGDVLIEDKIVHAGDTNTAIRFPDGDTFTVETSGTERIRIGSSGGVGLSTTLIRNQYFMNIAAPSQAYSGSTNLMDGGGICFQGTDNSFATGRTYPGIFWSGNTAALGRARAGILGISAANNDATDIAFITRHMADGSTMTPADEAMRISASGKVGIGTDDPYSALSIKTTAESSLTGNLADHGILLHAPGATKNDVLAISASFVNNDYLPRCAMGFISHPTVDPIEGYAGEIGFYTHDAADGSAVTPSQERVRINRVGRVGIGTTAPSNLIHTWKSTSDGIQLESPAGKHYLYAIQSNDNLFNGSLSGELGIRGKSGISFSPNNGTSVQMRLASGGNIYFGNQTTLDPAATTNAGVSLDGGIGFFSANRVNDVPMCVGRAGNDGLLIRLHQGGTEEGNISVSGSTVSYNGGHLSRWSQLVGISTNVKSDRPTIYQGTVMSNLDAMCEWPGEENQQLNKTKVSDSVGDKDVAGVFWAWDDDDDVYTNDFYVAMTGDMVIRVAGSTTVARGDLLESAGDGTAKPQSDDIVRSKTVAKITSTTSTATYADGSKAYPCVLMAC